MDLGPKKYLEDSMKITKLLLITLSLLLTFSALTACQTTDGEDTTAQETTGDPTVGTCDMNAINAEIDSMRVEDFTEATETTEYVKFSVKNYGDFIVRLRKDIAPITVTNFQKLVSQKFYDGLTFHRIMKGFMIQGGDPKGDGTGGSSETIKGEFSQNGVRNELSHVMGVISMARRSYPMDSASSQFFICNADASRSLDGSYAGFGYVVAGLEVILMVSDVEVSSNGSENSKPAEPVIIEKVCFVEKK